MMLRFCLIFLSLPLVLAQQRDKVTDDEYNVLIPLAEIPVGCGSPRDDYAIVDGKLEKCSRFLSEIAVSNREDDDYEKYKCKRLRVHGKLNEYNKCVCEDQWQGPVCNDYVGCPDGMTLYNTVCAPPCRHHGTLAFSPRNVECICSAPWDGKFCDRLACWRMAPKDYERRWKNARDHCECARGHEGENCDVIVSCDHGTLSGGECQCVEGYKGETCNIKCTPGRTCGCSRPALYLAALLLCVALLFR